MPRQSALQAPQPSTRYRETPDPQMAAEHLPVWVMAGVLKQYSQSPFRRQSRRGKSQPARRRKDERQTQTRRTPPPNKARMTPVYFQEFAGQLSPPDAPK